MSNGSILSQGHSAGSALDLLERARELARQARPTPSDTTIESTTHRGGDKGDKSGKAPFTSQELVSTRIPFPDIQADDSEVAWRVEAMWSQICPGSPIPFLVARDVPVVDGTCLSCGNALAGEERYRCAVCLKAATLVLASLRGDRPGDGGQP